MPVLSTALKHRIDDFASEAMRSSRRTGLVVGSIMGDEADGAGYGRISGDGTRAPDDDTIFEIGSVTKVFTALALADMAEEGLVGLDDPVRGICQRTCESPPFWAARSRSLIWHGIPPGCHGYPGACESSL